MWENERLRSFDKEGTAATSRKPCWDLQREVEKLTDLDEVTAAEKREVLLFYLSVHLDMPDFTQLYHKQLKQKKKKKK